MTYSPTDAYAQCLTALMDAVRTLTVYFPNERQVSFDPTARTLGADYWFFCTPGAFPNTRMDGRAKIYQWQTRCRLDVRYSTEAESVLKFIEVRGALQELLDKPRLLRNVNVNSILLSSNSDIQQDTPADEAPNFLIQLLTVTIEQIVNI